MAARGRGRGRGRGILDMAPGGLGTRNWAAESESPEDQADFENDNISSSNNIGSSSSDSPAGGGVSETSSSATTTNSSSSSSTTVTSSSSSTSQATLSLADMKSILEDSRTYSDANDVKRVLLCARNFVRNEDDVKILASLMYNKILEDTSLAKRGAEICDTLTSIEVGNTKFRSCLLSLVQGDYKARAELIASEPARFKGFLALLCEIFGVMRTATNEVFKPLVSPIYDCLNLVLCSEEGDEDDEKRGGEAETVNVDLCEVFALQLQSIGKLLAECDADRMESLMKRIRTSIIMSKSPPGVRCSLLEVLESNARGWESANNETTRFYCDMAVHIYSGLVL